MDGILAGIGGTDEEATVVAYVTKMINALGIGDYVKTTTMTAELGKKVDKFEGSRLMTNAEGTKLAGVAAGAQANVIEKIKVNGVEATPAAEDKSIALTIPTGKYLHLFKRYQLVIRHSIHAPLRDLGRAVTPSPETYSL